MSSDGKPSDRAPTCLRVSVSIAPLSATDERLADVLGNVVFDLAQLVGYPPETAATASIRVLEETHAAFVNNLLSMDELQVDLDVKDKDVRVRSDVRACASRHSGTEAWFGGNESTQPTEKPPTKTVRRKRGDLARAVEELTRATQEPQPLPSSSKESKEEDDSPKPTNVFPMPTIRR